MSKPLRVLVFPCGSECGLEIGRSLRGLKEIELFGASSVDDHGKFAYEQYAGGLPYVSHPDFIQRFKELILRENIQFVYPAMDSVVDVLAHHKEELGVEIVGSSAETTAIALSKAKTYALLADHVRCPDTYRPEELQDASFPVFLKPAIGCGSKGTMLARNITEVARALEADPTLMILENLPGEEYTVDCFTDAGGKLLFAGARKRRRISKGISVNTITCNDDEGDFLRIAQAINDNVCFNGAWFFQVKHAADGKLALLEIAPRIAGSMGLQRCKGVNLPLLSVLNQAGIPVKIQPNDFEVEYDRAFYNRVRISKEITTLYLDFDDCFITEDKYINTDLLKLVGQFRNQKRPVILVSRHKGNLHDRLATLGVAGLFDEIIHITDGGSKAIHLKDPGGLLIDDSFSERQSALNIGIAALGPESVEALLI